MNYSYKINNEKIEETLLFIGALKKEMNEVFKTYFAFVHVCGSVLC